MSQWLFGGGQVVFAAVSADVVPAKHKMQKGKMVPNYGYELLRWKASKGPVWVGHIFEKGYVGLELSHTLTEERGIKVVVKHIFFVNVILF